MVALTNFRHNSLMGMSSCYACKYFVCSAVLRPLWAGKPEQFLVFIISTVLASRPTIMEPIFDCISIM